MKNNLDFLNRLKTRLNDAPPNGNAEPRFWVIRDYEELVGDPAYHDTLNPHIVSPSTGSAMSLEKQLDDIKSDNFQNIQLDYGYTDTTMIQLKEDFDAIQDDDSALEFVQAWIDEDATLVYSFSHPYIVENTLFLSEEEAEDYLKHYGYNHSAKAHVYGMTGFRAFEYENLLKIVKTTEWNTINQPQTKTPAAVLTTTLIAFNHLMNDMFGGGPEIEEDTEIFITALNDDPTLPEDVKDAIKYDIKRAEYDTGQLSVNLDTLDEDVAQYLSQITAVPTKKLVDLIAGLFRDALTEDQ